MLMWGNLKWVCLSFVPENISEEIAVSLCIFLGGHGYRGEPEDELPPAKMILMVIMRANIYEHSLCSNPCAVFSAPRSVLHLLNYPVLSPQHPYVCDTGPLHFVLRVTLGFRGESPILRS